MDETHIKKKSVGKTKSVNHKNAFRNEIMVYFAIILM